MTYTGAGQVDILLWHGYWRKSTQIESVGYTQNIYTHHMHSLTCLC